MGRGSFGTGLFDIAENLADILAMSREEFWLSTEDVAREIGGVTPRWVRKQVEAGRLRARVLLTGERATYRIRRPDLREFLTRYVIEDAREREP